MASIQEEIKSNFNDPYLKARINLHFTHNFLNNEILAILKPFHLSTTQFNVLRILRGQFPKACSIGLIKERMIDKNSDASRVIDRLLKKQLVVRKECKIDRRQKDVLISKTGLDILKKIDIKEAVLSESLHHLSISEIETLNQLLDKIRATE
ncbi:MAG: MarR family winged helix-turn-helix transcriptional regulator [Lutibacter sp.]